MKKLIKIVLLAAVLAGAVVGLMYIIAPDNDMDNEPDFASAEANEWKAKIKQLCEDDRWTEAGYNAIQTGVHTDRVTSEGELISADEESALQKYLFTASCSYLNDMVDNLFSQTDYPADKVKSAEEMLAFLNVKSDGIGADSNLSQASDIISEYHRLLGCISFSDRAVYSHPLRVFSAMSADAARSRIAGMKYYNSHFSKNPSIKSRVSNFAANRASAESGYYMNLAKAVENHYRITQDMETLLDDQICFNQLSTNESAKSELKKFVENPNR